MQPHPNGTTTSSSPELTYADLELSRADLNGAVGGSKDHARSSNHCAQECHRECIGDDTGCFGECMSACG